MSFRDYLARRGAMPNERGLPWQQILDWFTPGNIYRHNENTGWSRPDLIGGGVQMATGLPVAGVLARMLQAREGRQNSSDVGRGVRDPLRFADDAAAISAAAARHVRPTSTERWLNGGTDADSQEFVDRWNEEHQQSAPRAFRAGPDGTTAAGRRQALGAGQLGSAGLAALLAYQNALNTRGGTQQER